MMRVLLSIVSIVGIGCTTVAEDRAPTSVKSDFTKTYQKKLLSVEKAQVDNEAEWEAHKEYLRDIDRGNRF